MIYAKYLSITAVIFLCFVKITFSQNTSSAEATAIQKVIQEAYIDGVFNLGDTLAIEKGFHEEFRLLGQQAEGGLRIVTKADWLQSVKNKLAQGKYPTPKENLVSANFIFIDVVEKVATVKLEFLIGGKVRYIDFLALYHFEEGWKIMNKVYHTLKE